MENYFSTALSLHWKKSPKCFILICTTLPVAILYSVAYYNVLNIPGVVDMCYFLSVPQDVKANVEKRFCTLVVDARVATGIAL